MKTPFSPNTMGMLITINEDGDFDVQTGGDLSNLSEEERINAFDLLFGLQIMLDTSQEMLVLLGSGVRLVGQSLNSLEDPDEAEPSELMNAIRERLSEDNVIPLFNKGKPH